MSTVLERLQRLPRSTLALVAASCLLVLPTAGSGWALDDVLVRANLLDLDSAWGDRPWWDLYLFARPDLNGALRDAGFHPWWSDPAVKMNFARPLSALTHAVDYALWPDSPALQHLHSVA